MHCDGDFHGEAHHIDALYRCVENELCLFRESRFGICKRDKKYERWCYHRSLGRIVFCELRLKNNMGRPDLIIIDNGFVWIEEIVKSEREGSLIEKKNKYPFKIRIVRCKE